MLHENVIPLCRRRVCSVVLRPVVGTSIVVDCEALVVVSSLPVIQLKRPTPQILATIPIFVDGLVVGLVV